MCIRDKWLRSWSWRVATSTTSPPGAPSPPSGPHLGTYFSRRKLIEPLPPRPPRTQMLALSSMMSGTGGRWPRSGLGDDRDEAAGALLGEDEAAAHLGEDGVVDADAGVVARAEPGSALAHDDRSCRDHLAGEGLDSEALRLGVATVAAGAGALLMRHPASPSYP